ncbi:hypothetical protein BG011_006050 [Mortierella polycephala]|uniref:Uncharacterized protein n=1 Tax=Mortierella polycephala TaxID=41804 RepID=A0A9P6PX35_9FUNG|nr:hypothetical protein BG011_006050 [Mortierella polycephala]
MSEQSSDANHPAHKANFVEKIMDKFRHHPHGQDQQAQATAAGQEQHPTMGGPENVYDNAYQGQANVAGAQAVPPMAYQTDPNYRQGQPQVPLSQGQTQPQQAQQRGQGYVTTSSAYGQTQPTNMPRQ